MKKDYKEKISQYTLEELMDVSIHIDKEKFPDRYEMIIAEIEVRKNQPKGSSEEQDKKQRIFAGFWIRFWAYVLDIIPVLLLWVFLYRFYFQAKSVVTLYYGVFPLGWIAYRIYFHGRWGQTLGKMAMKIKVVNVDFGKIDYYAAFKREIVNILIDLITIIVVVAAMKSIPSVNWLVMPEIEKQNVILRAKDKISFIGLFWLYADIICLLINKQKRSIHDFIGSTIVVREEVVSGDVV
ncbi:MAG: RDD family protein [Candidatus Omnitrophota bacterium]